MTGDETFLLHAAAWAVALVALVYLWLGLDDAFVDLYAWTRGLGPRRIDREGLSSVRALAERRIAVVVPAWREAGVIGRMLAGNLATLDYGRVDFYVGVYPNDPETLAEVRAAAMRSPRVHAVVGNRPGPTSKGQILNCVVRAVVERSRAQGGRYDAVLMQDAEDVMHPLSLRLLNRELCHAEFVQMPVFSLQVRHSRIVAGTYMDEFAESHTKDLLVRGAMGASVPSAGVATGLSWRLVESMGGGNGTLFNERSLTEDYELGLRARVLGFSARFACFYVDQDRGGGRDYIATREFFPSQFARSVRQKARWTAGIALQGWRNLGWSAFGVESYWRYRDRKALVTAPLSFVGYLCALYLAYADWRHWPLTLTGFGADVDLTPLLAVNAALMVNRCFQRALCTGRVYGAKFVPLLAVRWPVAILINALACLRAVRDDTRARLRREAQRWEKTEHELPRDFGLGTAVQTYLNKETKMLKKLALIGLVSGAAALTGERRATAAPPSGLDVESSPYVVLYKNRVEMAKLSVGRQQAVITFEQAKLERDRKLYQERAVALEELQQEEAIVQIATMTAQDFELRVTEAENLLNVTRARIGAGQDMPICSPYDSVWQSPTAGGGSPGLSGGGTP